MAQLVKNPPAMWETWVPSPDWEDPPGDGKGSPLQCPGLGESHGVYSPGLISANTNTLSGLAEAQLLRTSKKHLPR